MDLHHRLKINKININIELLHLVPIIIVDPQNCIDLNNSLNIGIRILKFHRIQMEEHEFD